MRNTLAITSVLIFAPALTFAGLFPTDIKLKEKTPECADVFAGGITGPGTGITIHNQCDHMLHLTKFTTDQTPFSGYLISADPKLESSYSAIEIDTVKDTACQYAPPPAGVLTAIHCSSIQLKPGESTLLFPGDQFDIEGENGLRIKGRSFRTK